MMTTLGATISKTLAKALFNWWTTSFPGAATTAGIVGVGSIAAPVGPPASGAPGNEAIEKAAKAKTATSRRCIEAILTEARTALFK